MIYTDVGCCCSLFDVVSSVVFSFCQQVSKQIVCFFFFFFFPCFFFFFFSLSLSPILLFSLSLFPFFVDFPHNLFFFFDSIATHMYWHVLSVLLTGQKKKKKGISRFTILSRFFVILVLPFCKLSETAKLFPYYKNKAFQGNKIWKRMVDI